MNALQTTQSLSCKNGAFSVNYSITIHLLRVWELFGVLISLKLTEIGIFKAAAVATPLVNQDRPDRPQDRSSQSALE